MDWFNTHKETLLWLVAVFFMFYDFGKAIDYLRDKIIVGFAMYMMLTGWLFYVAVKVFDEAFDVTIAEAITRAIF